MKIQQLFYILTITIIAPAIQLYDVKFSGGGGVDMSSNIGNVVFKIKYLSKHLNI